MAVSLHGLSTYIQTHAGTRTQTRTCVHAGSRPFAAQAAQYPLPQEYTTRERRPRAGRVRHQKPSTQTLSPSSLGSTDSTYIPPARPLAPRSPFPNIDYAQGEGGKLWTQGRPCCALHAGLLPLARQYSLHCLERRDVGGQDGKGGSCTEESNEYISERALQIFTMRTGRKTSLDETRGGEERGVSVERMEQERCLSLVYGRIVIHHRSTPRAYTKTVVFKSIHQPSLETVIKETPLPPVYTRHT